LGTQGAGFDEQRLREILQGLADNAKSNLAWIAANHTFFKSHQQDAPGAASALLALPERHLGVQVEQFSSPKQARKTWEKAVEDFHKLRDYASGSPADDPGHYLNKAALVYAAAVVEGFLSDAYRTGWKAVYPGTNLNQVPTSVRRFVVILGKMLDQKGSPKGNKNSDPYKNTRYPENTLTWACDALFLAEVRHAIVHNQGRVDEKFLEKVGAKEYDSGKMAGEIWAKDIWSNLADFQKDFKPPRPNESGPERFSQVCLNITKVIVPYLAKCAAFIDTSVDKLIAAVQDWRNNP